MNTEPVTHLRFPGMLALDIGGRSILATICGFDPTGKVKLDGEALHIENTPVFDAEGRREKRDFQNYVERSLVPSLQKALLEVDNQNPAYRFLPIGISFSGQITQNGEVYSAASIFRTTPLRNPVQLQELLRKHPAFSKREMIFLNNVSAAAWRLNVNSGITGKFLVLHLGTGVGSKIFDPRQPPAGETEEGLAGELGHVPVRRFLPRGMIALPCDCGAGDHLASLFHTHGIWEVVRFFADNEITRRPERHHLQAENHRENAPELIKQLVESHDRSDRTIGSKILEFLGSTVGEVLGPVVSAVGLEQIFLKGALFYRLGERATRIIEKAFHETIQRNLGTYFRLPRGFVRTTSDFQSRAHPPELPDRCVSLEGLVIYAAERYRTTYRITDGYYEGHPCYTLSYPHDLRYSVIRNDKLFEPRDSLLRQLTEGRKIVVAIDANYDRRIKHRLSRTVRRYFKSGHRVIADASHPAQTVEADVVILQLNPANPDGSENKSLEQVNEVIQCCHQCNLPRNGMLVGIGGGVILDIVGFAAQQYRRMIPYIRIPTTLIGQVDAGVGVKVGVNFRSAKNLVGAFYPPYVTINQIDFLYDLDETQIQCGLAEMIKMGVVVEASIVKELERVYTNARAITGLELRRLKKLRDAFLPIVDAAIRSMMEQLQPNIVEKELKRLVDFGHTFSPVIESLSQYRIPHGYAVAIDMYLTCHMAHRLFRADAEGGPILPVPIFSRYEKLLRESGLLLAPFDSKGRPWLKEYSALFDESIDKAIQHRGGNLNLVTPCTAVGEGGFIDLEEQLRTRPAKNEFIYTRSILADAFQTALNALYRRGTPKPF